MITYRIKPLPDWVNEENIEKDKFLTIRTTSLESFLECEYKYFMNDDVFTKYSIFHTGKQMHKYVQARAIGNDKFADKVLEEKMTLADRDYVEEAWNKIVKEYPEYAHIDAREIEYWLYLEYNPYLIYLEWTIDWIRYNEDGSITMVDYKSASSLWKTDKGKIQKYVYPFLYRQYNPEHKIKEFVYIVISKQSNPQIEVHKYEPNKEEVEKFVEEAIWEYVRAYSTKEYKTKGTKDWKCKWCKLKKDWTCPLFLDI